jgi:hypothetical protein
LLRANRWDELKSVKKSEEFTQIVVNSPDTVKDRSGAATDATPIVAERMWEHLSRVTNNGAEKVALASPPAE